MTPQTALRWPGDVPLALPLAPLIYLAWSDGNLESHEIEAIRDRLCSIGGLDDRATAVIAEWLNPSRPPSALELRRLLSAVKRSIPQLKDTVEYSIIELGQALAPEIDLVSTRAAVRDVEITLGMVAPEATREILAPRSRRDSQPVAAVSGAVDSTALRDLLDAPFADIRHRVRARLADPAFGYQYDLSTAEQRDVVFQWCQLLAAEGFGSLGMPAECGGAGDPGAFIAAFETISTHDLSLAIKFGVQFGLFGGSVLALGTERHHRRYLPDIGSLKLPGCFAMTELGHGSNVWDIETTATFDAPSQSFVIHTPTPTARKEWIGNAAVHGRMATVFAQLIVGGETFGVHAWLVPIRDEQGKPSPGVRIEDCGRKEGLNGVDNGRLWFDNVVVPRENLLNRFGDVTEEGEYDSPIASPTRRFFTMLGTLVGGRVSVALSGLSAAKSGLAIAVRYGAQRRQFGPSGREEMPILDYRTHQRRLMPRVATAYALDFALKDLAERYVAVDGDRREIESLAAGLKAYTTRFATDTLQECREACGGQGYLAVNRLASLKTDADIFTTFEGDNTVLWQLVAKSLLADFRDQFGELRVWGMMKFVADRAATRVREMNPVTTRLTDEEHLRDPAFHSAAFDYRSERLLASAARRLKALIDDGMDTFLAFNACQDHLVTLARAHIEQGINARFAAAIDRLNDDALHDVLILNRDLFALWRLERGAGWFLETGYFEGSKARAIRSLVSDLCAQAREMAIPLVDGYGIPDHCLAAPIAFGIDPRPE